MSDQQPSFNAAVHKPEYATAASGTLLTADTSASRFPPASQPSVNLSRLFSDVSKTFSGIRNILGSTLPQQSDAGGALPSLSDTAAASHDPMSPPLSAGEHEAESSLPFAGLFGGQNACFKTCGMEDIQLAARRAADLFGTLRICAIVLTVVIALSAATTAALILLYMQRRWNNSGGAGNLSGSALHVDGETLEQKTHSHCRQMTCDGEAELNSEWLTKRHHAYSSSNSSHH